MPRPVWKGNLSFGLVNIPISLYPGESRQDVSFDLLDKRDKAPIGYQKINKRTGKPVSKEDIVKAYEVGEGEYVEVDEEELKRADAEKTQRVDIEAFVDLAEIDPAYFDKPYYSEPGARSEKAYALFREAMTRTGQAGIGRIVLRTRQYLCAVFPTGPLITVDLMRFPEELRSAEGIKLPPVEASKLRLSESELRMAERLIHDLAAPWDPQRYHDEYRARVLELIERKAKTGVIEAAPAPERGEEGPPADIMSLLKQSVAHAETSRRRGAPPGRGRELLH